MKLSFLLLFIATLQAMATGHSQTVSLDLNMNNTSMRDVFREIERKTDLSFIFSDDVSSLNDKVSVNVRNEKVINILDDLFKDTDLGYRILNEKLIVIATKETLQNKVITGMVTDAKGEPLSGVSITIKGASQGTVTNASGAYNLTVPDENAVLVFSYVGFLTQEIKVGNLKNINVKLNEDTQKVDEVVVVGYGVQKRINLTGAVSQISSEKVSIRPAANTGELLQGMIAGLKTQQTSGLPGSDGTTLNIRGYSNNPLILIDGIESDLGQVDPNDIESVSVLKDASAAIYGARAGNGVILVTTKRGNDRKAQISYHGTVSYTQPTFLAKPVNALQWAEMVYETGRNPDDLSLKHVHYDPVANTLTNKLDGSNYQGYDWMSALFRNWTPQTQHNLNVRGGTDKASYFLSLGYTNQESNFTAGDYTFNRYNIRSNIDAKVTKDLSVSFDLAYRKGLMDRANVTIDDVFNVTNRSLPVYPYIYEADPSRATYSGTARSAYRALFKDYNGFVDQRNQAIQGAIELKYNVPAVQGLTVKTSLNFEEIYTWQKQSARQYIMWDYNFIAAGEGKDPWINMGKAGGTSFSVTSQRITELMPRLQLEYAKKLGEHNLHALAVGEMWSIDDNWISASGKDLFSNDSPYLKYLSAEGRTNNETASKRARVSYIGRVNYDYKSKYLVDFSIRADASAEYPPKGRWGYFPSISAGWRMSEEGFIKNNIPNVNNLKLRASYGVLGNDAVSSFDYLAGYEITGRNYLFGSSAFPAINSAGVPNLDITWETMKISNIGLDGIFFNGLIGFEFDAFYRLRDGILAIPLKGLPSTFGASMPQMNLNKQDNRGIELTLSHKNRIGAFSYEIAPMISWARGKYVKWEENALPVDDSVDDVTREYNRLWNKRYLKTGQWDNVQWGYRCDGFFMNQQEIDNYPINQDQNKNITLKPGDLKYKDLNGDNYIDWRDETIIATTGLPNTMYSLNLSASWKGLSLFMLWQGAANYLINIDGEAANGFQTESVPLDVHYKYRAIIKTDADGKGYISNPNTFKLPPAVQAGRTPNNRLLNDLYMQEAGYLRMKTMNLSYTLPQKWLRHMGINNTMLYVNATNLLTFSNLGIWKNSFDPEIYWQLNRQYPPVKTITVGLKLTL